ncbi:class F sortase [Kribbella turkmenica]|uniref:Class F sortase n=1 Tax=Kribbella turkmenica TaxID=2530375 RepID=A0A4R4X363_9ACTN|nr:class F sortase [Kribbella turkmenica]TDD24684.1 class F sortase [Kribbella turkmenica]
MPPARPATPPAKNRALPLALDRSEPVRIDIPRIKASSALEDLELDDAGVMTVPVDPDKAGWFTPSPTPGVIGSSVIAGHVTWNRRPVVFFRLGELRRGDRIDVAREDGTTATFTVDRIGRFAKDKFPTNEVYGASDQASLRLITCGGSYDKATRRYSDNVIVWANLTSSRHRN